MLNKNDPLIGAVQEVMKRNQAEREAAKLVNEKFGVTDRKALPHERQGEWDAAYKSVLTEGVEALDEKSFAALAPPYDKATQKDRLVGAGVLKKHPTQPGKHVLAKEENLDERVKENKIKKNKVIAKIGAKARKAGDPRHLNNLNGIPGGTGIRQPVGDTIRGRELTSGRERRPLEEDDVTSPSSMGIKGPDYATGTPDYAKSKEQTVNRAAKTSLPTGTVAKSIKEENLEEKAVSKAQQRFMGLVDAIKSGKAKGSAKAKEAAETMSAKEVKKYAGTKQSGLPEKVSEQVVPLPGAVKPRLEPMQGYGGDVAKRGIAGIRGGRGITAYDSGKSQGSQVMGQTTYGGSAPTVAGGKTDFAGRSPTVAGGKTDFPAQLKFPPRPGQPQYNQTGSSSSKVDVKKQGIQIPSSGLAKPAGATAQPYGMKIPAKLDPNSRLAKGSSAPTPAAGGARPSVVAKNTPTGSQASTGAQIGGARPSVVAKNTATAPAARANDTGRAGVPGTGNRLAKPMGANAAPAGGPPSGTSAAKPAAVAPKPTAKPTKPVVKAVRKAAPTAPAKPKMNALQQQMARSNAGRNEVAGPRKDARGLNVSSMTRPSRKK